MRILALDCALKTGWASFCNGIIESGVQDFNLKRGESKGMVFIRFRVWLNSMTSLIKPALIVFEQSHHRGGAATEVGVGLTTRIQEICIERGIEYCSCHSLTLKKFACGTGRANKEDMIKKAKEKWGEDIIDDNQADALHILDWARKEFKEER